MSKIEALAPARLGLSQRFGRLRRLIRKELAESLRDRRTIFTLVLMPLLLYPLMTIAFQQFVLSHRLGDTKIRYQVGVKTEEEAAFLTSYFAAGQEALRQEGTVRPQLPPGTPSEPLPPHTIPEPEIQIAYGDTVEEDLMKAGLDVALIRRTRGSLDIRLDRSLAQDWDMLYREDSENGINAVRYLRRVVAAANGQFLDARLLAMGVRRQRPDPVRLVPEARKDLGPKKPTMLAGVVPLILILMTITGAVYPAIDLTAGERERGTLEVLVAAPIPRLSVLFAKYVAVLTVAMLTAGVNLATMTITLLVTGIGKALFGGQALGPLVFVEVVGLLFLFTAFFSALLLALTSFARSFKEAQAYLIPLMLVSMTPGMIGLVPDLELSGWLAVVPLLNVVLLARDLIAGNASPVLATVIVLTTLLYAVAALSLAARVFGAEAVLYSQSSGWGDLFRRPSRSRDVPDPSSALLCLALMFPAYFLVTYGQVYLGEQPLAVALLVALLVHALIFITFPLTSLWLGRVRLKTALALVRPAWVACAAALLLGLCLWPLAHQVSATLRWLGLATLREEQLKQVAENLQRWREEPGIYFVLRLLILAGVAPLLEELFFRGYLFGALARVSRPGTAILTSAALFGAFHLFMSLGIALERFLPTALMGAVLGWVRWRTGSIWPGVLLHVMHNGLIGLLAYYQPQLERTGWIQPGVEFLPWTWVALSFAASCLAALLLRAAGKPPAARG